MEKINKDYKRHNWKNHPKLFKIRKPWCTSFKLCELLIGLRITNLNIMITNCCDFFLDDPSAKSQPVQVVSILYTVIPCLLFAIVFSSVVIFICWRYHKQIVFQASQSAAVPLVPVVGKPTYPKVRQLCRSGASGGDVYQILRSFCPVGHCIDHIEACRPSFTSEI